MSEDQTTITPLSMPALPAELQQMADHVAEAIRKEAEAQLRLGYSPDQAIRRARILLEPHKREVDRMMANWAAMQPLRVIVETKP